MNDKQDNSLEHCRRLPLVGAVNFRDIGGYYTVDGLQVRWQRLYRSDSLAELTDEDVAAVAKLGLRSVCDLRHASERERKPDRFPAGQDPVWVCNGFFPHRVGDLVVHIKAKTLSEDLVTTFLTEAYRRFPVMHADAYAAVLDTLIVGDALPALIHCTSGKDRTGFAVAVILMALGVSRETILEDYLLTNAYRRDLGFMLGQGIDPSARDALTAAHADYLQAAFNTIDERWGSDSAFIHDGLGFEGSSQRRLRELLLVAPDPAAARRAVEHRNSSATT